MGTEKEGHRKKMVSFSYVWKKFGRDEHKFLGLARRNGSTEGKN